MTANSYKGYINLILNDEEMAKFYEGNFTNFNILENEYILLSPANNPTDIVDKFIYRDNKIEKLKYSTIKTDWCGLIKPQDIYQELALDCLCNRKSKVKILKGVYGSGKDYLMFNKALELVQKGQFNKIIYVRPNVTLANVPQIGYLPNGIDEKLQWTLAPLYDKVGGEFGVEQLTRKEMLEMVPLLFIRGRSFENSIVYVTEAQNITTEIAKVLVSRIGEGSELWLNGDTKQVDNRVYNDDNGVNKMIDKFKGNPLFSYVYLPVTHRSDVANLANLLDE